MPLRLQSPRGDACKLPGVGRLQTILVEEILAPEHRQQDVVVGDRVPAALDDRDRDHGGNPASPLVGEPFRDVGDVEQVLVVEPGEDGAVVVDHVVPAARGELRGEPCGKLQVRNAVHAHPDTVLVSPLLHELVVPDVVRGDEVTPEEDAQARAPDLGRRLAGLEHGGQGCASDPEAGLLQKRAAADVGRSRGLGEIVHAWITSFVSGR